MFRKFKKWHITSCRLRNINTKHSLISQIESIIKISHWQQSWKYRCQPHRLLKSKMHTKQTAAKDLTRCKKTNPSINRTMQYDHGRETVNQPMRASHFKDPISEANQPMNQWEPATSKNHFLKPTNQWEAVIERPISIRQMTRNESHPISSRISVLRHRRSQGQMHVVTSAVTSRKRVRFRSVWVGNQLFGTTADIQGIANHLGGWRREARMMAWRCRRGSGSDGPPKAAVRTSGRTKSQRRVCLD